MIQDGFYSEQLIGKQWYVALEKLKAVSNVDSHRKNDKINSNSLTKEVKGQLYRVIVDPENWHVASIVLRYF